MQSSTELTRTLLFQRPGCPTLWFQNDGRVFALPMYSLRVTVEVYVSTAFYKLEGKWKNTSKKTIDAIFALPLKGNVSSIDVRIGEKRVLSSAFISTDVAQEVRDDQTKFLGKSTTLTGISKEEFQQHESAGTTPQPSPYEQYIPDLFRLPIPRIGPGESVHIRAFYIEQLAFHNSKYHLRQEMKLSAGILPRDKTYRDVVKIKCIINAISPETSYSSSTHTLKVIKKDYPRLVLSATPTSESPDAFELQYGFASNTTVGNLLVGPTSSSGDRRGAFTLFLTPPTQEAVQGRFVRSIVFMIDRSGSMTGPPFEEARHALLTALDALHSTDWFNVVALDHMQEYMDKSTMVKATDANKRRARLWLGAIAPMGGGTDIFTPLQASLKLLNTTVIPVEDDWSDILPRVVPLVILITDGAVPDEREIVRMAASECEDVRIMTLGIGSYCNWFFLKLLAQLGRGYSDVVVYKEDIGDKVESILQQASTPVLTDVALQIDGVKDVEVYPFPIPDLFTGTSLTVSGKFKGTFPEACSVSGTIFDGSRQNTVVSCVQTHHVPVEKVFLKERLDLLTAKAWLEESTSLQQEVVDLSRRNDMPSVYTTMVAFETNADQNEIGEVGDFDRVHDDEKYFDEDDEKAPFIDRNADSSSVDKKKAKKLAAGGVVLVGTAAFSFGDVAASIDNVPILGGEVFSEVCCDCCDLCGGCEECNCCDIFACIDC